MLKILFALNQNTETMTEEGIVKYCSNFTDEKITLYKEYDLSGVRNRLMVEEFDCIILNEELERDNTITTTYIDEISDKYPRLNIILIVSSEHERDHYVKRLFNIGVYNLIYTHDISVEAIVNLIVNPRSKAEAKVYLNINDVVDAVVENELTFIPDEQLYNILSHIENSEVVAIADVFEHVFNQYNEKQMIFLYTHLSDTAKKALKGSSLFESIALKAISQKSDAFDEDVGEKNTFNQKKGKTKIITKIEKQYVRGIPKQLIVIANLSDRAGSTFLTLNLAKAFSENIKMDMLIDVIEPPLGKPYIFDTYGLEMRLNKKFAEESKFYSYQHEISDNKILERDRETIEDGIVWIVPDSRRPLIKSWDYYKMMKLLYISKKSNISILDVGSNLEHEGIKPLLNEADKIFVIIDPMPAEIMQNHQLLDKLISDKNAGLPIDFIINRWTSGVKKKELMSFIKVKPVAYIPNIDTALIHKAIYDCNIPYSIDEVKEVMKEPLINIIKEIIPLEYIKTDNSKLSKFNLKDILINTFKRE